jgi:hypothetical protein
MPETDMIPIEERICKVKTFRKELDAVLTEIKSIGPTRNVALSITHLEDSIMRLGMELKDIGEANPTFMKPPYPDGKDPSNTIINPPADGVFSGMPAWQVRVIEEKKALDEKIEKLIAFSDDPKCKELSAIDQEHLFDQLDYMQGYAETLGKRIAKFK